ncbi:MULTISPECIES: hypothetical protein [Eisenbergiella]|uniref:hypothetical protein n=1 Tax=Eisenbergiella TaxID=1432051 RepID=UPI0023F4E67A|nr:MULTISPECIES: hypothetical protein [Eisenbergiella]MCI6710162.1 hypothetical protein [Eisenbergiella massiliensis]MDY5529336.1 hypothetical protein [Eisenbergiella porci]
MSTMVGMGAGKKAAKESDSKLRKENKELQKENEALRYRIAELEAADPREPQKE